VPDGYELKDGRMISEANAFSGVGGLTATTAAVPSEVIRTILSASYYPSAAETKTVTFYITGRGGGTFAVTIPVSIALTSAAPYPCLTEGMELKLFPGETLTVSRDSATAGSTMVLSIRYIDSDLPFYDYVEKQEASRMARFRRALVPKVIKGGGQVSIVGGGYSPERQRGGSRPK
jgi:hypothetical protein